MRRLGWWELKEERKQAMTSESYQRRREGQIVKEFVGFGRFCTFTLKDVESHGKVLNKIMLKSCWVGFYGIVFIYNNPKAQTIKEEICHFNYIKIKVFSGQNVINGV